MRDWFVSSVNGWSALHPLLDSDLGGLTTIGNRRIVWDVGEQTPQRKDTNMNLLRRALRAIIDGLDFTDAVLLYRICA